MDLYSKLNSALSESTFKNVPVVNEEDHSSGLSYMGQWNAIKWIDGKPYRDIVQNLIFDGNKIYIAFKDAARSDYSVPGGSKDISYSDATQVSIETREEAHLEVSNVKFTGLEYSYEQSGFKPPIKSQMCGKYVSLYVSEYKSESTANIDPSMTPDIFKNGKFYDLSEVFSGLRLVHKFGVAYRYMHSLIEMPEFISKALENINFNEITGLHSDPYEILKTVVPISEAAKEPSKKKKKDDPLDDEDFEFGDEDQTDDEEDTDNEDGDQGDDEEDTDGMDDADFELDLGDDEDQTDDEETPDDAEDNNEDDPGLEDDDFELGQGEEDPENAPDQNEEEEQDNNDDGENKTNDDNNGDGTTDVGSESDDTNDENSPTDDTLDSNDFNLDNADNPTDNDAGDTPTDNADGPTPNEGDDPAVPGTDELPAQEGTEDDGSVNIRVNILDLSDFEKALANEAMFNKWVDLKHKVESFKGTIKDHQMKIEDQIYDDIVKAVEVLLDNIDVYYKYKFINFNYEENIKNYAIFAKTFNGIIAALNESLEK